MMLMMLACRHIQGLCMLRVGCLRFEAVQTILVAPRVLVSHGSSSGIKTVFQPLLPELTLFCLVLAQPQASLRSCAHLAIATPCQSSTPLLLSIAVSARSRHRAGHKAVPRVPAIYRNNNW